MKMKRLVITWVLAAALFGLAGIAGAEQIDELFVNVSTTPDILDLGTASLFTDSYDVPGALTVKVDSNCFHGPIMISTTKLRHRQGGSISPDRIFVKTPETGGFITMARPVAISKSTEGPHIIVLDLRVQTSGLLYPAGEYTGTITLTVMPPA
jgi:hypothetical protein